MTYIYYIVCCWIVERYLAVECIENEKESLNIERGNHHRNTQISLHPHSWVFYFNFSNAVWYRDQKRFLINKHYHISRLLLQYNRPGTNTGICQQKLGSDLVKEKPYRHGCRPKGRPAKIRVGSLHTRWTVEKSSPSQPT